MHVMKTRALFLTLLATAAGCGGGGGGAYSTGPGPGTNSTGSNTPAPGIPNAVVVTKNAFTPSTLTTTVGSTVTWTWNTCSGADPYGNGGTCISHNVTFDQGSGNSPTLSSGSFNRTFNTAGTYSYHCSIHGSAMSGQVIVQ